MVEGGKLGGGKVRVGRAGVFDGLLDNNSFFERVDDFFEFNQAFGWLEGRAGVHFSNIQPVVSVCVFACK